MFRWSVSQIILQELKFTKPLHPLLSGSENPRALFWRVHLQLQELKILALKACSIFLCIKWMDQAGTSCTARYLSSSLLISTTNLGISNTSIRDVKLFNTIFQICSQTQDVGVQHGAISYLSLLHFHPVASCWFLSLGSCGMALWLNSWSNFTSNLVCSGLILIVPTLYVCCILEFLYLGESFSNSHCKIAHS